MFTIFACILLTLITYTDLRHRLIPNALSINAAIWGGALYTYSHGIDGLFFSVGGAACGFVIFLCPWLMRVIGAGDVKGFAALGALIGPSAIFQTFLYTALIGGVLSILYYVAVNDISSKCREWCCGVLAFAATRDPRCLAPAAPKKKHKIPYAPAMLLGYLAFLAWGNLV